MIDEVLRWAKDNKGEPGKPIPNIDAFGDGEMWDSGMKHLYGMRIEGAVKLPDGSTLFAVSSNDGVRVLLGGVQILEDGVVHADQIGRAHVRTPVTNAHIVCRLPLVKTKSNTTQIVS